MIIGLLNQKGGVGKTTLSVNLAGAFVELGYKVLLVDADPQGSSLKLVIRSGMRTALSCHRHAQTKTPQRPSPNLPSHLIL